MWTAPARSYLIDTLLLGMPVPPLYLRVTQDEGRTRVMREVVDGQQRMSAVLDYMQDKYVLSKSVESVEVAGKKYSQLSIEKQNRISQYSFICEVLYGVSDQEVLQIFARLNTHSVRLNAQELRNGKYFGPFKRTAYALALAYLEFWRRNHVFTERSIARMSEVEMTSELMILQLDGPQDKKQTIDDFYDKYDEEFPKQKTVVNRFRSTVDVIADSCGEVLPDSLFTRATLFYSLYAAVYHRLYSVPGIKMSTPAKGSMSQTEKTKTFTNAS